MICSDVPKNISVNKKFYIFNRRKKHENKNEQQGKSPAHGMLCCPFGVRFCPWHLGLFDSH
jgi:hypothetical protein